MKQKLTASRVVFLVIAVLILLVIAAVCLMPIWHVIMVSVSNPTAVTSHKGLVLWRLRNFDFQAYKIIFQYKSLWNGYLNTLMYIILSCVITGFLTV